MTFHYHVSGEARKALVKAMGEILECKPVYMFMPTKNYMVDYFTQHGTIVKTPSGYWQQVPQVSIAQTYLKIMQKSAEQFGLTPAARSRIISDSVGANADDELENLLGGDG